MEENKSTIQFSYQNLNIQCVCLHANGIRTIYLRPHKQESRYFMPHSKWKTWERGKTIISFTFNFSPFTLLFTSNSFYKLIAIIVDCRRRHHCHRNLYFLSLKSLSMVYCGCLCHRVQLSQRNSIRIFLSSK